MRAEKVLDKAQVHGAPNMQQYQGMPGPKTGIHPHTAHWHVGVE